MPSVWIAERIALAAGLVSFNKNKAGRGYKVQIEASEDALAKVKGIAVDQSNLSQHRTAVKRLEEVVGAEVTSETQAA